MALLSRTCGCNLPWAVEIPAWKLLLQPGGDPRECGRSSSEWDAGNAPMGQSQDTEERGKGEF